MLDLESPIISVETSNYPEEQSVEDDEISDEVEVPSSVPEISQQPESIATSRPRRTFRKPAKYSNLVAFALPVT